MRTAVESTLTTKGQITIPKRIREFLHINPKDKIAFEIEHDEVKIKHALSVESTFGIVKPTHRPENFRKIRESVEKAIGEEAAGEL